VARGGERKGSYKVESYNVIKWEQGGESWNDGMLEMME
jgi:hypothetical protein